MHSMSKGIDKYTINYDNILFWADFALDPSNNSQLGERSRRLPLYISYFSLFALDNLFFIIILPLLHLVEYV